MVIKSKIRTAVQEYLVIKNRQIEETLGWHRSYKHKQKAKT